jgi:P-type Cu2+ transporter
VDEPLIWSSQTDEVDFPQTAIAELTVEGMHCQSCASLIEEALLDHSCVASAVVDLGAARAEVTYLPAMTSIDHLCELVAAIGYQASPAPSSGVAS